MRNLYLCRAGVFRLWAPVGFRVGQEPGDLFGLCAADGGGCPREVDLQRRLLGQQLGSVGVRILR